MIVVLAGHVDHGKTALVQALTGVNTDRLEEEQRRGLTIDLGFAYAKLGGHLVGFVDVPGHHRFIQNMIAGVANQQHALLVIAADDGVMPQTREHVQILSLLGIASGTIAITKIDLVSKADLDALKSQIQSFVHGTFLQSATVLETSTTANTGIASVKERLASCAREESARNNQGCFRMAIDRAFSLTGQGTIVTGTVASGRLESGQQIWLSNLNRSARVRSLRVNDQSTSIAESGDRCGINLASVDVNQVQRGDWVCEEQGYLPVRRLLVEIEIVEDFPRPVKHWTSIHVYHATSHCEAHLGLLGGEKLTPGSKQLVEVVCATELFVKAGDRLILRDRDLQSTLGGGCVLAIPEYATKNRTENRLWVHCLQTIEKVEPGSVLDYMSNHMVVNLDYFRRSWNLSSEELLGVVNQLNLIREGDFALAARKYEDTSTHVRRILEQFHKANPDQTGTSRQLLTKLAGLEPKLMTFTLDRLVANNRARFYQGQYALKNFQQAQIRFDRGMFTQLEPLINTDNPMSLGDLSKRLRIPLTRLEQETKRMARAGVLVRINNRRIIHPARFDLLVNLARRLSGEEALTIAKFRDESKLGRNTVVQLLEYFDQIGLTRRHGDYRSFIES